VTPVLVDSSFFVALLNKREFAHRRCVAVFESVQAPLVTCEACITEALHLLDHAGPAVESILMSIEDGSLAVPFRAGERAAELRRLMRKYSDVGVDLADACLIQMADEFGTGDILTLDSDFRHYRWRRNRSFQLLVPIE
jgi:hypothetical protein